MCLACLNIADTAAFQAFVALGSIGLFVSYFIAIACMVHNRFQADRAPLGDWNMGPWGAIGEYLRLGLYSLGDCLACFPDISPGNGREYELCFAYICCVDVVGAWLLVCKREEQLGWLE